MDSSFIGAEEFEAMGKSTAESRQNPRLQCAAMQDDAEYEIERWIQEIPEEEDERRVIANRIRDVIKKNAQENNDVVNEGEPLFTVFVRSDTATRKAPINSTVPLLEKEDLQCYILSVTVTAMGYRHKRVSDGPGWTMIEFWPLYQPHN